MGLVWDTLRGLAFAQMLLVVILTFIIVRRAVIEAATLKRSWRQALPNHIWKTALGTMMISVGYGATALENLGGEAPPWYGSPFGCIAFTLLLLGLWRMVNYQNHAYSSRRHDPLDPSPNGSPGGQSNVVSYVMYAITLVAIVVLAYQVSGILEENCNADNKQDKLIGGLVGVSLEGARDPEVRQRRGLPAEVSPEEEEQIKKFEKAQKDLLTPEDCTN